MAGYDLPNVIGHRGAAAYAPENTVEGIREAARRAARWVEFDAKLTSDGVVILMHDDTLDRTTNGYGPVASASHADISRLDAGAWFGPAWRGVRVPTLVDALAVLAELDMKANVEIKPCPGREAETAVAVVEVLRRNRTAGRPWPLLSSFNQDSLRAAHAAAADIPRGLLTWEYREDWAATARAAECVTIHCSQQHLTETWAREILESGFGLAVYTVNDPGRVSALKAWGAQCFITDRPDVVGAVA